MTENLDKIRMTVRESLDDAIGDLLYYDRKEDQEVPVGTIEAAIADGELEEVMIVTWFADALRRGLREGR